MAMYGVNNCADCVFSAKIINKVAGPDLLPWREVAIPIL